MQKLGLILLGILIPTSAFSSEWEFDISAQSKFIYGYTDVSEPFEKQDGNNHFTAQTEINSAAIYNFSSVSYLGVFFDLMGGINRSLENYNQGPWGQEAYIIGENDYGRLMLGQTFSVANQFYDGAPGTGAINNSFDVTDFIKNPNWQRNSHHTKFSTLNSVSINTDGVAPKISYISPEYCGTALGFSYVPDAYNRRGLINNHASYSRKDGYIGAIYTSQEYNGLELDASFASAIFHNNDKELSASLLLKYGNWSLGGGWHKSYIDGTDSQSTADYRLSPYFDGYRESVAWEIGGGYQIGPYSGTLSCFSSYSDTSKAKNQIITFSNQYQYNKFLDIYLSVAHVDYRASANPELDDEQGYAFISGIGLNF